MSLPFSPLPPQHPWFQLLLKGNTIKLKINTHIQTLEFCFACKEAKIPYSHITDEHVRRHCHYFIGVQATSAWGTQWPQSRFCSGADNNFGFSKATPGQSHTWNLSLRKESSLQTGGWVKAKREGKIMVCLAENQSKTLNQSNGRKDTQQKSLTPAESTWFWARGWFYSLFPSPLKFSFYKVYCTVPTSDLPASLLTDRRDGIQLLFSLSQGQVHFIQGWWWRKNPVCWLPFRKPITWKNSRNAIAHLRNSNTDMKCSASSPLTHKMPWEPRREIRRIRAALQVTTHWRDALLLQSVELLFITPSFLPTNLLEIWIWLTSA